MVEKKNELVELRKEQSDLVGKVQGFEIISNETESQAVRITQELKGLGKRLKGIKDFFLKPFKDEVKKKEAEFKPIEKALKDAEVLMKDKIDKYEAIKEEKRRKEEEKLRLQQQKKHEKEVAKAKEKDNVPPPPPAPVNIEREKVDGMQVRKSKTFRIIDIEKVPCKFNGATLLMVDSKIVNKLIKAGVEEIPGLEIYEDTTVAIGSSKTIEEEDI